MKEVCLPVMPAQLRKELVRFALLRKLELQDGGWDFAMFSSGTHIYTVF